MTENEVAVRWRTSKGNTTADKRLGGGLVGLQCLGNPKFGQHQLRWREGGVERRVDGVEDPVKACV